MAVTRERPFDQCICVGDHELHRMLELMADGVDQITASRIVWAPELLTPPPEPAPVFGDTRTTWSWWIRHEVRRVGNAARRSLGLPELPADPGTGPLAGPLAGEATWVP